MKSRLVLLALFFLPAFRPTESHAEPFYDPVPAMTWDEMKNCELVVAAHYQSHVTGPDLREDEVVKRGMTFDRTQTLTLVVDRVLKGTTIKPGDAVTLQLRHLYTIETYPVDDSWRIKSPSDGIPRLCYKFQFDNPGGLEPGQIVPDVRRDMLYFLPQAANPALRQPGQVQPLTFEKEWFVALQGRQPSLGFRLTQNFSVKMRAEALEELDKTRDPATLDLLFRWLAFPGKRSPLSRASQEVLMTLADRKGDIYNRARRIFLDSADGWVPFDKLEGAQQEKYRLDLDNNAGQAGRQSVGQQCAQIMATANGERAARDFVRLIQSKQPFLAGVAQEQLGSTNSDYALNFALQWLESPDTVMLGAETVRKLLVPGKGYHLSPTEKSLQRTETVKQRLQKVVQLPMYQAPPPVSVPGAGSTRSPLAILRQSLGAFLPPDSSAPVSLTEAEKVLFSPDIDPQKLISSPFDSNWTPFEKEGVALLKAIDAERDPRFVPLLTRLMHGASPWLKSQEGYRAISHYWQMFPHAFKTELERQGVTAASFSQSLREGFPGSPDRLLNQPHALWSLTQSDNLGLGRDSPDDRAILLAKTYAGSGPLKQVLTDYCTMTVSSAGFSPDIDALHLLWLADPVAARPLIERVRVDQEAKIAAEQKENSLDSAKIDPRNTFAHSQIRFRFLALAVAAGHTELVDDLLSHFPVPVRGATDERTRNPQWYELQVLLWPDNPRVLDRYLQIADATIANSADDRPFPSIFGDFASRPVPIKMERALFQSRPREFCERVLRLLLSPSQAERTAGNLLLESVFYSNLGYDPSALGTERQQSLKTIAPLLERFCSMPEEKMRRALLQHLGASLPKRPTPEFAAERELLSSPNPVIVRNALRLLELETSDYYVDFLWNFPPANRNRLWNDMLADHTLALRDLPTPILDRSEPF